MVEHLPAAGARSPSMHRFRSYKTEAVVLRQMPLGEADRILTLFTPERGKLRAVAKGIRRPKSRFGGHLELLNRVSVSLAEGRNLDVLTDAQAVQSFRGLRDDLQGLSRAMYVAELVDRFSIERSPSTQVYRLLVEALTRLEQGRQQGLLLRYFEMGLLDRSGYKPELHLCVECRLTLEPADHYFSSAKGGVLCPECRIGSDDVLLPISLNGMKVLRLLQREAGFAGTAGLKLSPRLLAELERLLQSYIRYLVEREIKSAEFVSLVTSSPMHPGDR